MAYRFFGYTPALKFSKVVGNYIVNNSYGIMLVYGSSNNKIFHNNFINNAYQAYDSFNNTWDDGYPSGGNYWSDYAGTDVKSGFYQNEAGSDGIGDMPYTIDANNTDHYPLMAQISFFDAGTWNDITYYVLIISNSTLSDFYFNPDEGAFARFWVKGETETETFGFCRVAIPKNLLWVEDGWTVYVGDDQVIPTVASDDKYAYLFFTYNHSTKTIEIYGTHAIPEFPSLIILPLFMKVTLLAVIVYKKKNSVK